MMRFIPAVGRTIYAVFGFIAFVTVTVLLVLPAETFPEVNIISFDKFVHILIFGAMLLNFYLWKPEHRITLFILGVAYGVIMEFVQKYWCINRSFSVADMVADALGCLVGLWIANAVIRAEKK